MDVLRGKSSVSDFMNNEESPGRANGGRDNDEIPEEYGGQRDKAPFSEPPATPDDGVARRREASAKELSGGGEGAVQSGIAAASATGEASGGGTWAAQRPGPESPERVRRTLASGVVSLQCVLATVRELEEAHEART